LGDELFTPDSSRLWDADILTAFTTTRSLSRAALSLSRFIGYGGALTYRKGYNYEAISLAVSNRPSPFEILFDLSNGTTPKA
jgi:phosphoribosylaminoimidazole-succinocarboxamide synthase